MSNIDKETKNILLKFSKSLERVKLIKVNKKKELGGFRIENNGKDHDPEFRKLLFQNAPKTEGNFIISEKKKW